MMVSLLFVACTKEGDTIYQPDPDEEQPSTAPLVTVIYGPNSLGDRVYCDNTRALRRRQPSGVSEPCI